jgi:hypothetical protein
LSRSETERLNPTNRDLINLAELSYDISVCWKFVMSSPSIVPHQFQFDRDIYLVMDDLGGQFGRIWRETSAQTADPESILADMLGGQYSKSGSGRCLQYLGTLVAGCFRGCCARIAPPLRSRRPRDAVVSVGFCAGVRTGTSPHLDLTSSPSEVVA